MAKKRVEEMTTFTPKEKEIIDLICKYGIGTRGIKQVAEYLIVSITTVKTHLNNIYKKMGVKSLAELVYVYYQNEGFQK